MQSQVFQNLKSSEKPHTACQKDFFDKLKPSDAAAELLAVLPAEVLKAAGVQAVADALGQLVVKIQIVHHRQAQGQDGLTDT